MRPGATITSAAFSISVKPMRCKCINFAGLMEFYIRDVATRELSDILNYKRLCLSVYMSRPVIITMNEPVQ